MVYRLERGEKGPSREGLDSLVMLVAEYSRKRLFELGYKDAVLDDRMVVVMYGRLLRRGIRTEIRGKTQVASSDTLGGQHSTVCDERY